MPDYIPQSDAELMVWLNNFSAKIPTYGPGLVLTPTQVTNLTAAGTNTTNSINAVELQKTQLKQTTSAKEDSKSNSLSLIRSNATVVKQNVSYTDAIGQDLGIVGTSPAPDFPNMKPALTLKVFPGHINIGFTKKGFTGVNIYTRLQGISNWTFLARDTNSPYTDNRPLAIPGTAETREYMAMGLDTDDEVGQQSDIVSTLFGG